MIAKSLLAIAVVLALAVAALLLYASRQPDSFQVQRSLRIQASAERIHPLINDLRRFNTWNPYMKKDPGMVSRYHGPDAGPGAGLDFEGDGRTVGRGSIAIVESSAPQRVVMTLDMHEPFKAHNQVTFTLVPRGDGVTEVTWAMQGVGPLPLMAKVMHLFFDMDRMVGTDFEVGLADLKTLAERS
ncbi:SRPBCC family protein [Hylemonella gracilis]|uniref:SRPBCC family protein n=1 Tax=Hylemonella gracilis TaxID=80880 RepID=UPI0005510BDF|nr:SRPBCC family protein [Hylemonella gracilis]